MTDLTKFTVTEDAGGMSVELEVDLQKLTPALATEINEFWGDHERRLFAEDGDVVRTVIRLYGARLIGLILAENGSWFDEFDPEPGRRWTEQMQQEEGWPGTDGSPHGALGIRVVASDVEMPGFHETSLSRGTPL